MNNFLLKILHEKQRLENVIIVLRHPVRPNTLVRRQTVTGELRFHKRHLTFSK